MTPSDRGVRSAATPSDREVGREPRRISAARPWTKAVGDAMKRAPRISEKTEMTEPDRPLPRARRGAPPAPEPPTPEFEGLDEPLARELASFELFFKTFGFKRVHGRVWGLLVLAGQPLSSREISNELGLSQGATSTSLNELAEWGAIQSGFDAQRRCHLHAPIGNTLSIVATVFRRREQVVFGKFKQTSLHTLAYVRSRYGEKDPRVLTLRSIITSLEIAEAVMQLVFSSVERALGDSESILSRAVNTALKIGMKVQGRPRDAEELDPGLAESLLARLPGDDDEDPDEEEQREEPPRPRLPRRRDAHG